MKLQDFTQSKNNDLGSAIAKRTYSHAADAPGSPSFSQPPFGVGGWGGEGVIRCSLQIKKTCNVHTSYTNNIFASLHTL